MPYFGTVSSAIFSSTSCGIRPCNGTPESFTAKPVYSAGPMQSVQHVHPVLVTSLQPVYTDMPRIDLSSTHPS